MTDTTTPKLIDAWNAGCLACEVWRANDGELELRVRPHDETPTNLNVLATCLEKLTGLTVARIVLN